MQEYQHSHRITHVLKNKQVFNLLKKKLKKVLHAQYRNVQADRNDMIKLESIQQQGLY